VSTASRPTTAARPPLLELRGLTVRYGNVGALTGSTRRLPAGEITCVLGENGSGKSTLVACCRAAPARRRAAAARRRAGALPLAAQARAAGIATVWQDLAVAPLLSVWRNFFLGAEPTRGAWPLRRLDSTAREVTVRSMARVGVPGWTRPPGQRAAGR
jgi:simple sugar transport system ATP-binding protein